MCCEDAAVAVDESDERDGADDVGDDDAVGAMDESVEPGE